MFLSNSSFSSEENRTLGRGRATGHGRVDDVSSYNANHAYVENFGQQYYAGGIAAPVPEMGSSIMWCEPSGYWCHWTDGAYEFHITKKVLEVG